MNFSFLIYDKGENSIHIPTVMILPLEFNFNYPLFQVKYYANNMSCNVMPTLGELNGLDLHFNNLKVNYFLTCFIKLWIILNSNRRWLTCTYRKQSSTFTGVSIAHDFVNFTLLQGKHLQTQKCPENKQRIMNHFTFHKMIAGAFRWSES